MKKTRQIFFNPNSVFFPKEGYLLWEKNAITPKYLNSNLQNTILLMVRNNQENVKKHLT